MHVGSLCVLCSCNTVLDQLVRQVFDRKVGEA
jgi:hypothetical protein